MISIIAAMFGIMAILAIFSIVRFANEHLRSGNFLGRPKKAAKSNASVAKLDGPYNLPLVGYLPFITEMPHVKFQLLSQKYGPVFKICLGKMKTIVLNDFESINEAFKKEEFLGRPKDIAFNVLINLEGLGTLSGPQWREQKRFTMHQLRNLGFGNYSIEQRIMNNIEQVIDNIDRHTSECAEQPLSVRQLFDVDHFSIVSLLFGTHQTTDKNDEGTKADYINLKEAITNAIRSLRQVSVLTFFPELARLVADFKLLPFVNQLKENFVIVNAYIKKQIESHERTLDEHSVRDYIDSFLLETRRRRQRRSNGDNSEADEGTFTQQMLAGNVQGFLAAGIETVRTSIEWALLTLAVHQDVQTKMWHELRRIGPSASSWSNRSALIYTQAVIHEIERWKTISPLNLMRITTAPTTLAGVHIDAGVFVIANLWAVHFDHRYWHEPTRFNPDRFIAHDGQLIKHRSFIPFSIGKRSCPGESLAQMEIFLFLTCLLQKYEIRLKSPNENLFDEGFGLTLQPKQPVHLQFIKRRNSVSGTSAPAL